MHEAQERKLEACAGPSNTRSGHYTANKLLTVLLLWRLCVEPVYRTAFFAKTRPGGPPTSKRGFGRICA